MKKKILLFTFVSLLFLTACNNQNTDIEKNLIQQKTYHLIQQKTYQLISCLIMKIVGIKTMLI